MFEALQHDAIGDKYVLTNASIRDDEGNLYVMDDVTKPNPSLLQVMMSSLDRGHLLFVTA